MAEINGIKVPFIPIVQQETVVKNRLQESSGNFGAIFQQEMEKVRFSGHAVKRLEARNIQLSETELDRLQNAVEKAESKGSKDSLIMMDKTAFVVNIPNKTVVTALSIEESKDNVFTNIDSVVIT